MLGIGYFKAEPTEFAKVTVDGSVKRDGLGVSCFYLAHRASFELVGTTSIDQPFEFMETTADNQTVTLQGGFVYRVTEPPKVLKVYNFAIDPRTKEYLSEDHEKLPERMLQIIRAGARRKVQETSLEKILVSSDSLSEDVFKTIPQSPALVNFGVSVEVLYFSSIQPQPEMLRALGATYRNSLLEKSDKAEYTRRAQAVEQERAIKENEIHNAIEIERRKEELIKLQVQNMTAEARAKAEAAKLELAVFAGVDPEMLRAYALHELGRDAKRIETLVIAPELLAGLRNRTPAKKVVAE